MPTPTCTQFDIGNSIEYNQDGNASSCSLVFTVQGTDDEAVASSTAKAAAAALETGGLYNGMSYNGSSCERLATNCFRVTVKYRLSTSSVPSSSSVAFQSREWSTVTLKRNVKTLLLVRDQYHSANYPAPHGVNEDIDGEVHGTEVEYKALRLVERWSFKSSRWTAAYRDSVLGLLKCVNDAVFRGFDAGEVLFDDFVATERNDGFVDLSFTFNISKNGMVYPGETDAGTTPGLTKNGWDLEWHTTARDASGASLVIWAETGPVYYDGDFSLLGLG